MYSRIDKISQDSVSLNELRKFANTANLQVDNEILSSVFKDPMEGVKRADFIRNLIFVPLIETQNVNSKQQQQQQQWSLKYFYAGGLAGVVSRTCTAPFDRIKVFLITHQGGEMNAGKAAYLIYKQGGWRAFFKGNGLNVVKVLPDSAMKFGGFETAKRVIANLEGVDLADLSQLSTFLAGGLGGVVSQLIIYPIDTVKYRVQCGGGSVPKVLIDTYKQSGVRTFYRGLSVGLSGMFPFAALDLGIFSLLKAAYIKRNADDKNIGTLPVLSIGALSGSIGASVVYPVNLIRTRIQSQQTVGHPYKYINFRDCFRQTIARDGWKGLFRGLGPNLAKVAPSVAISYLVYERAKRAMHLK